MRKLFAMSLVVLAAAWAQTAPSASGHWEGTIRQIPLTVDLSQTPAGTWIGSISIPAANVIDLPLINIAVDGTSVRFAIPDIPGNPSLEGKLSADGNELSGNTVNPDGPVPFTLARKGEAKVKVPPPNSPLSKAFEGNWEGSVEVDGKPRRVVLKLSRAPDGTAIGTLGGDQPGDEIAISSVMINDRELQFDVRAVGGKYSGGLGGTGEINGIWSLGAGSMPLRFKRSARP
jgi:hypothetical protein